MLFTSIERNLMPISEEDQTEAFEEWWEKEGKSEAQVMIYYTAGKITIKQLFRKIWNASIVACSRPVGR